jgi:hypothetical protein
MMATVRPAPFRVLQSSCGHAATAAGWLAAASRSRPVASMPGLTDRAWRAPPRGLRDSEPDNDVDQALDEANGREP